MLVKLTLKVLKPFYVLSVDDKRLVFDEFVMDGKFLNAFLKEFKDVVKKIYPGEYPLVKKTGTPFFYSYKFNLTFANLVWLRKQEIVVFQN